MEHLLKDAGNENVNLYYKFSTDNGCDSSAILHTNALCKIMYMRMTHVMHQLI